jgi:hypothetical protein
VRRFSAAFVFCFFREQENKKQKRRKSAALQIKSTCQNVPKFEFGLNVAGPATPIVDFRWNL